MEREQLRDKCVDYETSGEPVDWTNERILGRRAEVLAHRVEAASEVRCDGSERHAVEGGNGQRLNVEPTEVRGHFHPRDVVENQGAADCSELAQAVLQTIKRGCAVSVYGGGH